MQILRRLMPIRRLCHRYSDVHQDFREPFLVRCFRTEIAVDLVLGRRTDFSQVRAKTPSPWSGHDQTLLFHQSRHNLFRYCYTLPGKQRLQSAIAVAAMVAFEYFRQVTTDGDVLVFQVHSGTVVEVRASRNPQLQKQF